MSTRVLQAGGKAALEPLGDGIEGVYDDEELGSLYDLVYDGYDDDLGLYEQFAARGETPSLELAVGSGRVALHLARQGHEVVGVDAARHMLERLRGRLDDETSGRVRLVEADMRDFDLGETFDLVYCAFFSFEQLLTTAEQLAALACVRKHLAPAGVFVMEVRNLTAVDWSDEASQGEGSPLQYDWTRADSATGEMITKMRASAVSRAAQRTLDTIIFDRQAADGTVRRRTLEVSLRVTGRYEMELLLRQAGLKLRALYGGADLSPFDDRSDSMVVVAELEGT